MPLGIRSMTGSCLLLSECGDRSWGRFGRRSSGGAAQPWALLWLRGGWRVYRICLLFRFPWFLVSWSSFWGQAEALCSRKALGGAGALPRKPADLLNRGLEGSCFLSWLPLSQIRVLSALRAVIRAASAPTPSSTWLLTLVTFLIAFFVAFATKDSDVFAACLAISTEPACGASTTRASSVSLASTSIASTSTAR